VVQDIRKYGFDVLLMLEATIGLNEVDAKESNKAEQGTISLLGVRSAKDTPFTQKDLHFLRSLRIAVEGEAEDAAASDTE